MKSSISINLVFRKNIDINKVKKANNKFENF